MTKRKKVVVLYGGRSTEHEVSLRSAAYVLRHLDQKKYRVLAIGIDQNGQWIPQNTAQKLGEVTAADSLSITYPERLLDNWLEEEVARTLVPSIEGHVLDINRAFNAPEHGDHEDEEVVVFPVLHGTYGEDGCLQGLLEMSSVAYVGADTLSSALCMDKVVAKELVNAIGVPVVPYVTFRAHQWEKESQRLLDEVERKLQFPVFIKPAGLGSSVGISVARDLCSLTKAIESALEFDDKLLIEKAMDIREIQFAALGGYDPEISGAGEIEHTGTFYSYEVKYLGEKTSRSRIPAELSPLVEREGQEICRRIFSALQLYGMARIDLFLTKGEEKYYFNEVNTIPGFTNVSQYGQLWGQKGVDPSALMDRLIDAALSRFNARKKLKRSIL